MTFRTGDLNRVNSTSLSLADLLVDQVIDGRVKKVEDYGLFIEIEGSKLSGLCHKSEVRMLSDIQPTAYRCCLSYRITKTLT